MKKILITALCITLLVCQCAFASGGALTAFAADEEPVEDRTPPIPDESKRESIARGIDISRWNGEIDFDAVKESGIDFVIIRVSYSGVKDIAFEQNYEGAHAAGLAVGAYVYSYAESVEDARDDAREAIGYLEGKTLEYPLYYDLEDEVLFEMTAEERTDIALGFIETAQMYGFYAGVYSSQSWYQYQLQTDRLEGYPLWFAKWPPAGATSEPPDERFGVWQYWNKGDVPGIKGDVDLDIGYVNYPDYIMDSGLNGYGQSEYDPRLPFSDVKKSAWYFDCVRAVYEGGIFKGVTSDTFAPLECVTRGMFVTVIGRLYGVNTEEYTDFCFEDVKKSKYYAPYVAWAKQSGIVNGISDSLFAPEDHITREQMCAMIYRYSVYKGLLFSEKEADFIDKDKISAYARDAVEALAGAGIVNGTGGGYFSPKAKATRCECAAIITRIS